MASYGPNILLNAFAASGHLTNWRTSGVTINSVGALPFFRIAPEGWMEQSIRAGFLVIVPVDWQIRVELSIEAVGPRRSITPPAEIEMVLTYAGEAHTFNVPVTGQGFNWIVYERVMPSINALLEYGLIRIRSNELPVRVTSCTLRRNNEVFEPEADQDSGNDRFGDEAIMFGLERDLPALR